MTSREKLLIGAVAAAGALWVGAQGMSRYRAAVERNSNLQVEAERALSEDRVAERRGHAARKQLNQWRRESLPTNREIAESLYQDWLRSQLIVAGLTITQLADKSGSGRNPQFSETVVEIRADGTLAQLADFLYRFYTAPHLHRISTAAVTASEEGKKLSLTMSATALILPDATHSDALAEGDPKPIEGVESLDKLRERLTSRNVFAAFQPKSVANPQDAARGTDAVFDWSDYGDRGWQMRVRIGDSKEVAEFHVGDKIEIGGIKGKVVEIESRRAVIETDKGRFEVRFGQKFSEAAPLGSPAA